MPCFENTYQAVALTGLRCAHFSRSVNSEKSFANSCHSCLSLSHFLTLLCGLSPPAKASGSTVLKPPETLLSLLVLSRLTGLCSSITSTISSSGGRLLVSSIMTVSLLLSLRGGVLSRLLSTSMISLADTLEAGGGGLRGEDLRVEVRRERRSTTSVSRRSSITEDCTAALPPRPKQVYISQRSRRKPATEPKTMPTTVPGAGPAFSPEYVVGIRGFIVCVGRGAVAVTVTTCRRNKEARDRGSSLTGGTVLVGRNGKSMGSERGASLCKEGRSDRRARGCRIRSAEDVSRGGIASNMESGQVV